MCDLTGLDGYRTAWVLMRYRGTPVAYSYDAGHGRSCRRGGAVDSGRQRCAPAPSAATALAALLDAARLTAPVPACLPPASSSARETVPTISSAACARRCRCLDRTSRCWSSTTADPTIDRSGSPQPIRCDTSAKSGPASTGPGRKACGRRGTRSCCSPTMMWCSTPAGRMRCAASSSIRMSVAPPAWCCRSNVSTRRRKRSSATAAFPAAWSERYSAPACIPPHGAGVDRRRGEHGDPPPAGAGPSSVRDRARRRHRDQVGRRQLRVLPAPACRARCGLRAGGDRLAPPSADRRRSARHAARLQRRRVLLLVGVPVPPRRLAGAQGRTRRGS